MHETRCGNAKGCFVPGSTVTLVAVISHDEELSSDIFQRNSIPTASAVSCPDDTLRLTLVQRIVLVFAYFNGRLAAEKAPQKPAVGPVPAASHSPLGMVLQEHRVIPVEVGANSTWPNSRSAGSNQSGAGGAGA